MTAIRLAVVDDSTFVRKAIERMLVNDARLDVVGTACSGEELLANLERWDPDVITLDLSMPGIGGLVTLDRIMTVRPTPVVILSTHAGRGAPQTIEALHRGAADFIDKQQYSLLDFASLQEVLVTKILAVAAGETSQQRDRRPSSRARETPSRAGEFEILAIGASTGGPPAIELVLTALGGSCPVPVLVVQHMPEGFTRAFADRLNIHLPLEVREAEHQNVLEPGTVHIGPAGKHLRVGRNKQGRLVSLLGLRPADVSHRPAVDELFFSMVDATGDRSLAVLLTGMGKDGAEGMLRLRQAGAHTLVQDELTSVVFGMPGAAVNLQAVDEILPIDGLGRRLGQLLAE